MLEQQRQHRRGSGHQCAAWFDEQRFIEAGRTHFLALQQHWDAAEMDKIAGFVTPQMLSFLKEERASLGEGYQSTYIDDLSVQLDGIDELADKTVATLDLPRRGQDLALRPGRALQRKLAHGSASTATTSPGALVAIIRQNG